MKRYYILAIFVTLMLCLTSCSKQKKNDSIVNKEIITTIEDDMIVVPIYGIKIKYPSKWVGKITINSLENKIYFSYNGTQLFDLIFNDEEGDILGTVEDEENIVIRVISYSFDSNNNDDLIAMQKDINVILDNLSKDYTFYKGKIVEKNNNLTFDITSSFISVHYPEKWKKIVKIDIFENRIRFSNEGISLFDITCEECDGYLIGTYNKTPIYIIDYDVETNEQRAMQEDINVIIQNLINDPNFVVN